MPDFVYNNLISFLVNLTTAYLIFYLVLSVKRGEISVVRLLIGGGIIAFYAVLKGYLKNATLLLELIIIVIALLLIKREYTFSEFCKTGLIYSLVLLVCKGLEALIVSYIDPNETLSSLIVCFSVLLTTFIVKVIGKLSAGVASRKLVYTVELMSEGKTYKTRAFWDSGNLLYDEGVPVILISKKTANKLTLKENRQIAVNTVTGIKLLDGGDISVKIFLDKKSHKVLPVRYCVSDTIISRGYDVLLHRDMEVI